MARLEKALEEGRDRLEALAADQLRLRVELSCVPDSHAAAAAAAAGSTGNANANPPAAGHGHGMPVTHSATPNTASVPEYVPSSPMVSPPAAIAATVPKPPGADFLRVPASSTVCPVPLGECSSHVTVTEN